MISDEDLRLWIKPVEDEEIELLRILERAAVAAIEKRTGRYFGPAAARTEDLELGGWPLVLANDPIGGVLTTFKSWDGSAWQTVDATTYYLQGRFIRWNSNLPPAWSPLQRPSRYQVVYQAGYAQLEDPNAVDAPADIKREVLRLVGHMYENRGADAPGSDAADAELLNTATISDHSRVSV